MFKHILIPTDGSPVSAKAVKAGIALAREAKARVTGYHAIDPLTQVYGEGHLANRSILDEIDRSRRAAAKKHVAKIAQAAKKAGVPFKSVTQITSRPDAGILDEARKHKCDLIFMASHGRNGLERLLVGSVAGKVVQRATIPVLVYR